MQISSPGSQSFKFHFESLNQKGLFHVCVDVIPYMGSRLTKTVVVSLFDRLMIAATTTHNQTNRKSGQKLMNLTLILEDQSLGPFYTITTFVETALILPKRDHDQFLYYPRSVILCLRFFLSL